MRITENKIDEIRNAADIVDIVGGYVQLRKRGKNFIGLCPFHQEKTPSFTVSDDKQIYHCFGCGNGGNVFKFLMEFKNISFVESVEEIAAHLGIKIQTEESTGDQQNELEVFYDINVIAARFFLEHLTKSAEAEEAREYLKHRKIKPQTQRSFGIGFAPFGWDNFLNHAKQNKIDLVKAKQLGLIDTNERGEYYDKFRARIIFPIFSPNGRVIAFGGRVLQNADNVAKYLNSPESQIYFKRKSLYGLYHSKDEIRKLDRAILVEGYMDLVSLYQAGVKNVVASSGTSLTDEQIQLLSRFTKNIFVLFDSDSAGQKAALRSIELLLKQNFEVKVITLPKGEDPDSFINKFGKEQFDEEVTSAVNFLEYQTSQFELQGMFEDPAEMTKAIRELVRTLALVNDELKRNLLMKTISKKFNLREKLIESELNAALLQNKTKVETQASKQFFRSEESAAESKLTLPVVHVNQNPNEKELLRLLFSGDEKIIGYIFDNVAVESFVNTNYMKLAELVHDGWNEEKFSPADLVEKIESPELKNFVMKLSLNDEAISKKWDDLAFNGKVEKDTFEHAVETVRSFQIFQIEDEIKRNNKIISESKDELLHIELLQRNRELQDDRKAMLNLKANN
ncbi:MAG: DNA primase [Ignavibacteria bacterium]|nr:MAG: DNA primase [Ignavibacteria bacterium]KAF0156412.1 MAG: DNA primase [Ignavibacteria bacterium]